MKQFVVTHTIRRTEIPALLDRLQTHLLWKVCVQKLSRRHTFVTESSLFICWSTEDGSIVFLLSKCASVS